MTFSDETLFQCGIFTVYFISIVSNIYALFTSYPYGKFYRSGWGPTMPAWLAWFLMEIHTLWLTIYLFPFGQHAMNPKAWILMSPYFIHYFHRALFYPFLLRTKFTKRLPISMWAFATVLNLIIIYIQTREVSHYNDYYNDNLFWVRVFVGFPLFLWGLRIRIFADSILPTLKREDDEYKIPKGGWFELISCPHYFGELLEWFSWSIMTGSMVTAGLFVFTLGVIPRAHATHKWYQKKFENYPKTRKSIIPYVF